MQLRIGSLFSGYGGLDLAIESFFGARTIWHSQYEPPDKKGRPDPHQYAARILAHHWPDATNYGDITQINFGQVEPVDILTGGFPCTDVSLAGQRAGLNDQTRSGLWAHMARAIAALQPRLVVIENVRGLLSAPADGNVEPCTWCMGDGPDQPVLRALGAVLADLASLGFDAEWLGLPASAVGAPHERFRVFIIAWPADPEGPRLEVRREGRAARLGAAAADTDGQRGEWHRPSGRDPERHFACSGGHRPAEDANLAACGERRLAAPGQEAGWGTRADARGRGGALAADSASVGRGEGRPEPARLVRGPDAALGGAPDWGVYEPAIRRWEHVTGRAAPAPVGAGGRLAPVFVEWMMGLPAGWITDIPAPDGMTASQVRNAQLKAGGNGVVPQQAYAALAELWHRATAQTALTAA